MKSRVVDPLRRDEAQAAQRLDADRDAKESIAAAAPEALAGGKHRGHDHGAGMHRPAFERVVEVLAMRCGAVHERGVFRAPALRVPDRGARTASIEAS